MALRPALRVVEYDILVFRKSWRGVLFVSLVSPIFFLGAMGLGLGGLVRSRSGGVGGVSYLEFLAPGLLVTTAMQTAAAEMTYPIMARVQWLRIYEATLNTPIRVLDLLVGELLWLTLRLAALAAVFLGVSVCFGPGRSVAGIAAVLVATATGLAFGAPILAYSATQRTDAGFNALNRFIVLPLFLLGGCFFPVTQLPRALQGVAWMTPLSHGVALARDLFSGTAAALPSALHLAVLVVYFCGGVVAAHWTLRRRLVI